tara:strand:- start:206 stop:1132 length:927 start_codon:yes stop_codon:yes gene_type:complete
MSNKELLTKKSASRDFFSGIIDYAGFFPPAQLEYLHALANYIDYSTSEYRWILSRFISPTAKFEQLAQFLSEKSIDKDIDLVAILRPHEDIDTYISKLPDELEAMNSLPDNVRVSFIETKLPSNILTHDISSAVNSLVEIFKAVRYHRIFLEFSGENYINYDVNNYVDSVGIKVRCGGPTLNLVPSVELLSEIIVYAADNKIPVKFTAGLHHPILHFDPVLGGMAHGFLNVFMASAMAYSNTANYKYIYEVLNDQDPENFIFNTDSVSYKDCTLPSELVQDIRKEYVHSFGTCSFDDPITDLTSLGII